MARHRDRDSEIREMMEMRHRFEQEQEDRWEELLDEFAGIHGLTDEEVQQLDMDTI